MARDPYRYFRVEAREIADQLGHGVVELEGCASGATVVPRLLRLAHTLKGAARVVRQPEIAEDAHAIEDALGPFRDAADSLPREPLEIVLRLVDHIAARVAALDSPEQAGPAEPSKGAARPNPESNQRSISADLAAVDELLDGLAEAHLQARALTKAGTLIGQARRMAELMADQLSAARRDAASGSATRLDRSGVIANELRGAAARLEGMISLAQERIDRELRHARDRAEQLRLVPAAALFPILEHTARDAAGILGKQVEFRHGPGDIRIDRHAMRVVQEALIQMVRNAVAHGIEPPEERRAAGKAPAGLIQVHAERRGQDLVFRCSDDGRGIDFAAIRAAAIRAGRSPSDLDALGQEGLLQMLLRGGLTTSARADEVSGRGIGMDIIRDSVATLGAKLDVDTRSGAGATLELRVPLSISSVESLLIQSGGFTATIPLEAVRNAVRLKGADITRSAEGDAIIHAGGATPLVPLAALLGGAAPPAAAHRSAVVVGAGAERAAISVDRLLGTSNIVFRPLPDLAPAAAIVAGASLDLDGSPRLMLDPAGLVASALRRRGAPAGAEPRRRPLLVIDDSLTTRMLEQSILESAGYQVEVASSAEEGLERAHAEDYGLFLVDVEMPGMDGFTFIEHIRRDPRLHGVPAILVTSLDAPEHRRRGEAAGAQGFLVKSEFNQSDLLRRIEQLVN